MGAQEDFVSKLMEADKSVQAARPKDAIGRLAEIIAQQMEPRPPNPKDIFNNRLRFEMPESASPRAMLDALYGLARNPPPYIPYTPDYQFDDKFPEDI